MTKSKAENEEDRQDKEEREEDRQEREARKIAGYPDQGLPGRPPDNSGLPGFERPVPGETGVERKAREARNADRAKVARSAVKETEAETLARLERERPAGYEPAVDNETAEEKKARDQRNLALDRTLRGDGRRRGESTYQEDNAPPPEPEVVEPVLPVETREEKLARLEIERPAGYEPAPATVETAEQRTAREERNLLLDPVITPASLTSGVQFRVTKSDGSLLTLGIELDSAAQTAAGFDPNRQPQGKIEFSGLSAATIAAFIPGKLVTVTLTVIP